MPLLLLLALCLSGWPAWAGAAVEIVDARGVTVRLAAPAQRIVSLLPSLTESVCALGQCQRLVGVDRFSNQPPQVQTLPHLGGGLDPQIEAVVALRPDLVLLAASSPAVARLQALGLTVAALEPQQHADVHRSLQLLGVLLGVEQAEAVWADLMAQVDAQARTLPPHTPSLRVYVEVSDGPYAAGTASFIGETLSRLGVRNIVPPALGTFPRLNPEFVVRADPDVIILADSSLRALAQRPGWMQLRAVREKRLCVFNQADSELLVRPGPRLGEGARLLAQCLRDKGQGL